MRGILRFTFIVLLAVFIPTAPAENGTAMLGFGPESAAKQRAIEEQLDRSVNKDNLHDWLKHMSARPHHVGSPYGKEVAEFMLAKFKEWGFDAQIEEFHVLFPTPKTQSLRMLEPEKFTAKLEEARLAEDSTSGQKKEQLPAYNAYSIDGDVTGELVYVNYGLPSDYEELERRGIDVKGKIAIARYGASWRGIKPKVAAEKGAIGCIIYSDPKDDGYFRGDVYPEGAYKNEFGAQRGSVADMPLFTGDPLTPGGPSTKDAKRIDLEDAKTLTAIPVLPISYSDALPLLRAMGGPVAPEEWRGALPITYHLGPGPAKVRLNVEFNWDIKPAYNVIAKLRGSELPNQWVIRGNHHDAWVNGADDPISGMVAVMEEARIIGELAKQGKRPRRTIVYCGWDAEEPGLIGSTEWVELHARELVEKAAVYINSDSNGRGFLYSGGSHTLEKLVNEVAREVADPQKNIPVSERLRAARLVRGAPDDRKDAHGRADLRISALGSGSDYTPFIDHLGIASLNVGFGGEDGGGSYHTIYDSYDHYIRFGDPNFDYGKALVQTAGRLTLRFANADVLPFEFKNFAETISKYVKEIDNLTNNLREETERENGLIAEGRYDAALDPKEALSAPKPKDPVPYLNLAPLENAAARVKSSAERFEAARSSLRGLTREQQTQLDEIMIQTERALTSDEGLPRRPWYKHQIYAPGFYTGYGVKTLPGVREAIEQRDWREAEEQAVRIAEALNRFSDLVDRAAQLISASGENPS